MKLSNLSLAVLVALGVAACGGSDDNNNQTQDPPPPGDNNGGNTPPPPADNSQKPQDPARVAPGMDVQDAVKQHVQVAKTTYAAAGARDLLTGYAPNGGIVALGEDWRTHNARRYEGNSTDKQDVKRASSMVNYVETAQFRTDAINPAFNGAVLANPGFTYALGSDDLYYRMEPIQENWDETSPNSRYQAVDPNGRAMFPANGVTQERLFFMPNVVIDTANPLLAAKLGTLATVIDLDAGQLVVNPQRNSTDFNVNRGEVLFNTAEFNGKTYDISTANAIEKVDLNTIPVKKEIQYLPVRINYSVKDTKGTGTHGDDTLTKMSADAGAMKAYNLPYSLAFVTVNEAGADKQRMTAGAAARNLFDYPATGSLGDLGAYQVVGYQSPYLPRNGRADYVGQSFGVDSKGDIKLRADFGATGAHISGSVSNRTFADGSGTLPEIFLANIKLSQPGGNLNTTGTQLFGNEAQAGAARARNDAGTWDVQLFGPDAEEAGGVISFFRNAGTPQNPVWVAVDSVIPGGVEVFTSQRGVITQDSNIAPTP